MEMEERLNKDLTKVFLFFIKFIPMIISALYLLNIILSYYGIENDIISIVGGMSVLPTIFVYLASYLFKFCSYHRMFIHYITVNETICWYDYEIGIPIDVVTLLKIELTLSIVFLFIILYLRFNVCKK